MWSSYRSQVTQAVRNFRNRPTISLDLVASARAHCGSAVFFVLQVRPLRPSTFIQKGPEPVKNPHRRAFRTAETNNACEMTLTSRADAELRKLARTRFANRASSVQFGSSADSHRLGERRRRSTPQCRNLPCPHRLRTHFPTWTSGKIFCWIVILSRNRSRASATTDRMSVPAFVNSIG